MSHEALIEDLRQKSRARIKRIRIDAEAGTAKLRKEKKKELERQQEVVMGQLKSEAEKVAAPILHEAKREALSIEDEAVGRLAEKLYVLATGMLDQVRDHDYETIFAELVKEVPQVDWELIQVNPKDKEMAMRYFQGCTIEEDPAIIGGFLGTADGGQYKVINTLQKRLEKGWPTILTLLLQEIIKDLDS